MAELIRMPKMSDTMEEGVIAEWHVKVGDKVKSGDVLAEVETDKATMDMESFEDGTVLYIGVKKGESVPVDAPLLVIGQPGEDYESLLGSSSSKTVEKEIKEEVAKVENEATVDTSNINAEVIRMPLLSDTMTEGVINSWLVKVGDKVKAGDVIAEIQTDKATMELESYEDGELLYIGVKEGEAAPINSVIAVIGEKGADYQALIANSGKSEKPQATQEVKATTEVAPVEKNEPIKTEKASSNGRVLASPLAKKIAQEKGINLSEVKGSGENGRIIKNDVDNFKPSSQPSTSGASAPVGEEKFEKIPLSQMRKAIAKGLSFSKSTAPEFYLTMEINMDKVISSRVEMNEISPVKITFNDIIIKACAAALAKHPEINSSWRDDHIRRNYHVNIGMAVAIDDGLLVPVIRYANTLSLSQIAAETKRLGNLAKSKELQPSDWEGNTFTISNLGSMGIEQFTSIINNPSNESCILAVGGIKEIVAVKEGNFYATNVMKITLTCDHRVVDGATGAAFLVTLKSLIEEPVRLLV